MQAMRSTLLVVGVLLLAAAAPSRADWWDDFVTKVSEKVHEGASYLKETAGPVVRDKFDQAKEKLQDPETHAQVQQWFKETVFPVVEEKWNQAKDFVSDEVAPEIKKIVSAAREGNEKLKEKDTASEE